MTSLTFSATNINTLSAGIIWLLICGGASAVALLLIWIACRVAASISDVPVDGESL